MNKQYLVISYYPAPYEGSPYEIVEYCDSLEEARTYKSHKNILEEREKPEFRAIITIYEAIEIK